MNNFDDIMTEQQIKDMATYIQLEAPKTTRDGYLALMKDRMKIYVDPKDYPTKPSAWPQLGRTSSL